MSQLDGHDLAGRAFSGLTVSWYEHRGVRSPEPVHVWLDVAGPGRVLVATSGDGRLRLTSEEPYTPYAMPGPDGRVSVEQNASWKGLSDHLGVTIRSVRTLLAPHGHPVGLVLGFGDSAVGIANLHDEIAIAPWPSTYRDQYHLIEADNL